MKAIAVIALLGALTAIAMGWPLTGSARNDVVRCGTMESDSSSRHRRAATGSQNSLWDNAVVPFVLSDSIEGQPRVDRSYTI